MKIALTAIALMAATLAYAAPAPYPLTVNSRAQTAPPVLVYRANEAVFRVSFTDGNDASAVTNQFPFMAWSTNATAAVVSTAAVTVVNSASGIVDFAFSPASINHTAGRYIYEVGVRTADGTPRVFRQGTFSIYGSPVGGNVAAVNWTTNMNWGAFTWQSLPTITVNGVTGNISSNLNFSVSAEPSTNQVKHLHDTQSERYYQTLENGTGTVGQITGPFTNALSVTLSEDFLALNGELRPAWTNHTFPFVDGVWIGTTSAVSPYAVIGYSDFDAMWADYTGGGILEPANANAQGTATLIPEYTYYTTNVSSRFATDAALTNINANLNACYIAISNQVEGVREDVDALPSALQPYTLTRYGDLAATNTAGFAGFITTNGTLTSIQTVDPTAGAKLAQFRYDITSTIYGTANWSSWIQSAVGTPDSVTFARMLVYSAGDVLIASNDGAVVRINVTSAASNFTASVALPYAVTNGYIVTEIYNVSNTTKNAFVHTGGIYPATLTFNARPLNYATVYESDSAYVKNSSGTATNLTVATSFTLLGVPWDWSSMLTNGTQTATLGNITMSTGTTDVTYGTIASPSAIEIKIGASKLCTFLPYGTLFPTYTYLFFGNNDNAYFLYDNENFLINPQYRGYGNLVVTSGNLIVNKEVVATNFVFSTPRWIDEKIGGLALNPNPSAAPARVEVGGTGSGVYGLGWSIGDDAAFSLQMAHGLATTNALFPNLYYAPHLHVSASAVSGGSDKATFVFRWQIAATSGSYATTLARTNTVTFSAPFTHQKCEFGTVTNNVLSGRDSVLARGTIYRIAGADDVGADVAVVDSVDFHIPIREIGSFAINGDTP